MPAVHRECQALERRTEWAAPWVRRRRRFVCPPSQSPSLRSAPMSASMKHCGSNGSILFTLHGAGGRKKVTPITIAETVLSERFVTHCCSCCLSTDRRETDMHAASKADGVWGV